MRTRLAQTALVVALSASLLKATSMTDAQAPTPAEVIDLSTPLSSDLAASGRSGPTGRPSAVEEPTGPQLATRAGGLQVILVHKNRPVPRHVPAPPRAQRSARTAAFAVRWNPDTCQGILSAWPHDAKTAFGFAVDVWSSLVVSTQPVTVDACWRADLGPSVLGSAGPTTIHRDFTGAPFEATWYSAALANALTDDDLNGNTPEIVANFSSGANWHFGIDGNPPASQVDFATVVVHELAHGLGFVGAAAVDTGDNACGTLSTGDGCIGYLGYPLVYDRFTEDGVGNPLLAYASPSTALGDALTGGAGGVYFDGTHANAANTDNGQSPVRLYTPPAWQPGSSYSHLDEIFNGTPNSLMTYSLGNREVIHHPGPVTLGMFQDTGWTTTGSSGPLRVYVPLATKVWPPTQILPLHNGAFEDGRSGWTTYSTHPWHLIVEDFPSGVTPHSGSWAAWLGGANENVSYLEQRVTVPLGSAALGYWYWVTSTDFCGRDVGSVLIDGTSVAQHDLCVFHQTGGWARRVVDLEGYGGQTIRLQIRVETDGQRESNLFVDEVAFQAARSGMDQTAPHAVRPVSPTGSGSRNSQPDRPRAMPTRVTDQHDGQPSTPK